MTPLAAGHSALHTVALDDQGRAFVVDPSKEDVVMTVQDTDSDDEVDEESVNDDDKWHDVEQKRLYANGLFARGEYAQAIDNYSEAIALVDSGLKEELEQRRPQDLPTLAILYSNRAAAYMAQNKYRPALEDCRRALVFQPKNTKAHFRSGKCCIALGQLRQAEEALDMARVLEPTNQDVKQAKQQLDLLLNYMSHLERAVDAKDHAAIVRWAGSALDLAPAFREPRLQLARALLALSRDSDADKVTRDLLHHEANDADAWYLRAVLSYRRHESEKSSAACTEALRTDPDHKQAFTLLKRIRKLSHLKQLGNEAYAQQRHQDALQAYSEALQLEQDNAIPCCSCLRAQAVLFSNRAAVLMQQKRYQEALDDCSKSLQRDPEFTKVRIRRATCYSQLNQLQSAVDDLTLCAEQSPNDSAVQKQLREAKRALKRTTRVNYYQILGVDERCDQDDIRRAYRKLALQFHPDKQSQLTEASQRDEAEKKFKQIGEAYETLNDPQKRRRYDMKLEYDQDSDEERSAHAHSARYSPFGHGGFGQSHFHGGFHGGFGGHPFFQEDDDAY